MSIKYNEIADLLRLDLMHYLCTKRDKKVIIICPDKVLKREIFNDIYTGFCNLHLQSYIYRQTCTDQPNIGELDLTNGSSLRVITYNPEGLCGETAHMVIVIESEKFNTDDLEDILISFYPIIKQSGGQIIGIDDAT